MPFVGDKRFPYTGKGVAAAQKARQRISTSDGTMLGKRLKAMPVKGTLKTKMPTLEGGLAKASSVAGLGAKIVEKVQKKISTHL